MLWVLCRYPLLFWLQGLQANIGMMMVLRGWRNAISAEGWLVRRGGLQHAFVASQWHDQRLLDRTSNL